MIHGKDHSDNDEYFTPAYVFEALGCRFDMDVCYPVNDLYCSVPADRVITEDSLNANWSGFVWMNPPWSGRGSKDAWLDKLREHDGGGIALTPDRTSAPWWQKAIKQCDAVLFVNHKIKFIVGKGAVAGQPANGVTLLAYGLKAVEALQTAEANGLGIVWIKK